MSVPLLRADSLLRAGGVGASPAASPAADTPDVGLVAAQRTAELMSDASSLAKGSASNAFDDNTLHALARFGATAEPPPASVIGVSTAPPSALAFRQLLAATAAYGFDESLPTDAKSSHSFSSAVSSLPAPLSDIVAKVLQSVVPGAEGEPTSAMQAAALAIQHARESAHPLHSMLSALLLLVPAVKEGSPDAALPFDFSALYELGVPLPSLVARHAFAQSKSALLKCRTEVPLVAVTGTANLDSTTGQVANPRGRFTTIAVAGPTITRGRWYFEVTVRDSGIAQIGWACENSVYDSDRSRGVGDTPQSWSWCGSRNVLFHGDSSSKFGLASSWQPNDVIGCRLDMSGPGNGRIGYSINGRDLGWAFDDVTVGPGTSVASQHPLVPQVSVSQNSNVVCVINAGGNPSTPLQHAPAGYLPVAAAIPGGVSAVPLSRLRQFQQAVAEQVRPGADGSAAASADGAARGGRKPRAVLPLSPRCLRFKGGSGVHIHDSGDRLCAKLEMTVQALVCLDNVSTDRQIIFCRGRVWQEARATTSDSDGAGAWALSVCRDGSLEFAVRQGTRVTAFKSKTGVIAGGKWAAVAATFKAGRVVLYVDGAAVLKDKNSSVQSLPFRGQRFFIASDSPPPEGNYSPSDSSRSYQLKGKVAYVRLWCEARAGADIAAEGPRSAVLQHVSNKVLMAQWLLNEGAGRRVNSTQGGVCWGQLCGSVAWAPALSKEEVDQSIREADSVDLPGIVKSEGEARLRTCRSVATALKALFVNGAVAGSEPAESKAEGSDVPDVAGQAPLLAGMAPPFMGASLLHAPSFAPPAADVEATSGATLLAQVAGTLLRLLDEHSMAVMSEAAGAGVALGAPPPPHAFIHDPTPRTFALLSGLLRLALSELLVPALSAQQMATPTAVLGAFLVLTATRLLRETTAVAKHMVLASAAAAGATQADISAYFGGAGLDAIIPPSLVQTAVLPALVSTVHTLASATRLTAEEASLGLGGSSHALNVSLAANIHKVQAAAIMGESVPPLSAASSDVEADLFAVLLRTARDTAASVIVDDVLIWLPSPVDVSSLLMALLEEGKPPPHLPWVPEALESIVQTVADSCKGEQSADKAEHAAIVQSLVGELGAGVLSHREAIVSPTLFEVDNSSPQALARGPGAFYLLHMLMRFMSGTLSGPAVRMARRGVEIQAAFGFSHLAEGSSKAVSAQLQAAIAEAPASSPMLLATGVRSEPNKVGRVSPQAAWSNLVGRIGAVLPSLASVPLGTSVTPSAWEGRLSGLSALLSLVAPTDVGLGSAWSSSSTDDSGRTSQIISFGASSATPSGPAAYSYSPDSSSSSVPAEFDMWRSCESGAAGDGSKGKPAFAGSLTAFRSTGFNRYETSWMDRFTIPAIDLLLNTLGDQSWAAYGAAFSRSLKSKSALSAAAACAIEVSQDSEGDGGSCSGAGSSAGGATTTERMSVPLRLPAVSALDEPDGKAVAGAATWKDKSDALSFAKESSEAALSSAEKQTQFALGTEELKSGAMAVTFKLTSFPVKEGSEVDAMGYVPGMDSCPTVLLGFAESGVKASRDFFEHGCPMHCVVVGNGTRVDTSGAGRGGGKRGGGYGGGLLGMSQGGLGGRGSVPGPGSVWSKGSSNTFTSAQELRYAKEGDSITVIMDVGSSAQYSSGYMTILLNGKPVCTSGDSPMSGPKSVGALVPDAVHPSSPSKALWDSPCTSMTASGIVAPWAASKHTAATGSRRPSAGCRNPALKDVAAFPAKASDRVPLLGSVHSSSSRKATLFPFLGIVGNGLETGSVSVQITSVQLIPSSTVPAEEEQAPESAEEATGTDSKEEEAAPSSAVESKEATTEVPAADGDVAKELRLTALPAAASLPFSPEDVVASLSLGCESQITPIAVAEAILTALQACPESRALQQAIDSASIVASEKPALASFTARDAQQLLKAAGQPLSVEAWRQSILFSSGALPTAADFAAQVSPHGLAALYQRLHMACTHAPAALAAAHLAPGSGSREDIDGMPVPDLDFSRQAGLPSEPDTRVSAATLQAKAAASLFAWQRSHLPVLLGSLLLYAEESSAASDSVLLESMQHLSHIKCRGRKGLPTSVATQSHPSIALVRAMGEVITGHSPFRALPEGSGGSKYSPYGTHSEQTRSRARPPSQSTTKRAGAEIVEVAAGPQALEAPKDSPTAGTGELPITALAPFRASGPSRAASASLVEGALSSSSEVTLPKSALHAYAAQSLSRNLDNCFSSMTDDRQEVLQTVSNTWLSQDAAERKSAAAAQSKPVTSFWTKILMAAPSDDPRATVDDDGVTVRQMVNDKDSKWCVVPSRRQLLQPMTTPPPADQSLPFVGQGGVVTIAFFVKSGCSRGYAFLGFGGSRTNRNHYLGSDQHGYGLLLRGDAYHQSPGDSKIANYSPRIKTGSVVFAEANYTTKAVRWGIVRGGRSAAERMEDAARAMYTSPRGESGPGSAAEVTAEETAAAAAAAAAAGSEEGTPIARLLYSTEDVKWLPPAFTDLDVGDRLFAAVTAYEPGDEIELLGYAVCDSKEDEDCEPGDEDIAKAALWEDGKLSANGLLALLSEGDGLHRLAMAPTSLSHAMQSRMLTSGAAEASSRRHGPSNLVPLQPLQPSAVCYFKHVIVASCGILERALERAASAQLPDQSSASRHKEMVALDSALRQQMLSRVLTPALATLALSLHSPLALSELSAPLRRLSELFMQIGEHAERLLHISASVQWSLESSRCLRAAQRRMRADPSDDLPDAPPHPDHQGSVATETKLDSMGQAGQAATQGDADSSDGEDEGVEAASSDEPGLSFDDASLVLMRLVRRGHTSLQDALRPLQRAMSMQRCALGTLRDSPLSSLNMVVLNAGLAAHCAAKMSVSPLSQASSMVEYTAGSTEHKRLREGFHLKSVWDADAAKRPGGVQDRVAQESYSSVRATAARWCTSPLMQGGFVEGPLSLDVTCSGRVAGAHPPCSDTSFALDLLEGAPSALPLHTFMIKQAGCKDAGALRRRLAPFDALGRAVAAAVVLHTGAVSAARELCRQLQDGAEPQPSELLLTAWAAAKSARQHWMSVVGGKVSWCGGELPITLPSDSKPVPGSTFAPFSVAEAIALVSRRCRLLVTGLSPAIGSDSPHAVPLAAAEVVSLISAFTAERSLSIPALLLEANSAQCQASLMCQGMVQAEELMRLAWANDVRQKVSRATSVVRSAVTWQVIRLLSGPMTGTNAAYSRTKVPSGALPFPFKLNGRSAQRAPTYMMHSAASRHGVDAVLPRTGQNLASCPPRLVAELEKSHSQLFAAASRAIATASDCVKATTLQLPAYHVMQWSGAAEDGGDCNGLHFPSIPNSKQKADTSVQRAGLALLGQALSSFGQESLTAQATAPLMLHALAAATTLCRAVMLRWTPRIAALAARCGTIPLLTSLLSRVRALTTGKFAPVASHPKPPTDIVGLSTRPVPRGPLVDGIGGHVLLLENSATKALTSCLLQAASGSCCLKPSPAALTSEASAQTLLQAAAEVGTGISSEPIPPPPGPAPLVASASLTVGESSAGQMSATEAALPSPQRFSAGLSPEETKAAASLLSPDVDEAADAGALPDAAFMVLYTQLREALGVVLRVEDYRRSHLTPSEAAKSASKQAADRASAAEQERAVALAALAAAQDAATLGVSSGAVSDSKEEESAPAIKSSAPAAVSGSAVSRTGGETRTGGLSREPSRPFASPAQAFSALSGAQALESDAQHLSFMQMQRQGWSATDAPARPESHEQPQFPWQATPMPMPVSAGDRDAFNSFMAHVRESGRGSSGLPDFSAMTGAPSGGWQPAGSGAPYYGNFLQGERDTSGTPHRPPQEEHARGNLFQSGRGGEQYRSARKGHRIEQKSRVYGRDSIPDLPPTGTEPRLSRGGYSSRSGQKDEQPPTATQASSMQDDVVALLESGQDLVLAAQEVPKGDDADEFTDGWDAPEGWGWEASLPSGSSAGDSQGQQWGDQPASASPSASADLGAADIVLNELTSALEVMAQSPAAAKHLTAAPWLSLLLFAAQYGPLAVHRRVLRLLRGLLSSIAPGSITLNLPHARWSGKTVSAGSDCGSQELVQFLLYELGRAAAPDVHADSHWLSLMLTRLYGEGASVQSEESVAATLAASEHLRADTWAIDVDTPFRRSQISGEVVALLRTLLAQPAWRGLVAGELATALETALDLEVASNDALMNPSQDDTTMSAALDAAIQVARGMGALEVLGGEASVLRVGGAVEVLSQSATNHPCTWSCEGVQATGRHPATLSAAEHTQGAANRMCQAVVNRVKKRGGSGVLLSLGGSASGSYSVLVSTEAEEQDAFHADVAKGLGAQQGHMLQLDPLAVPVPQVVLSVGIAAMRPISAVPLVPAHVPQRLWPLVVQAAIQWGASDDMQVARQAAAADQSGADALVSGSLAPVGCVGLAGCSVDLASLPRTDADSGSVVAHGGSATGAECQAAGGSHEELHLGLCLQPKQRTLHLHSLRGASVASATPFEALCLDGDDDEQSVAIMDHPMQEGVWVWEMQVISDTQGEEGMHFGAARTPLPRSHSSRDAMMVQAGCGKLEVFGESNPDYAAGKGNQYEFLGLDVPAGQRSQPERPFFARRYSTGDSVRFVYNAEAGEVFMAIWRGAKSREDMEQLLAGTKRDAQRGAFGQGAASPKSNKAPTLPAEPTFGSDTSGWRTVGLVARVEPGTTLYPAVFSWRAGTVFSFRGIATVASAPLPVEGDAPDLRAESSVESICAALKVPNLRPLMDSGLLWRTGVASLACLRTMCIFPAFARAFLSESGSPDDVGAGVPARQLLARMALQTTSLSGLADRGTAHELLQLLSGALVNRSKRSALAGALKVLKQASDVTRASDKLKNAAALVTANPSSYVKREEATPASAADQEGVTEGKSDGADKPGSDSAPAAPMTPAQPSSATQVAPVADSPSLTPAAVPSEVLQTPAEGAVTFSVSLGTPQEVDSDIPQLVEAGEEGAAPATATEGGALPPAIPALGSERAGSTSTGASSPRERSGSASPGAEGGPAAAAAASIAEEVGAMLQQGSPAADGDAMQAFQVAQAASATEQAIQMEHAVQQLLEFGFNQDAAMHALAANGGDVASAADFLFAHGGDLQSMVASTGGPMGGMPAMSPAGVQSYTASDGASPVPPAPQSGSPALPLEEQDGAATPGGVDEGLDEGGEEDDAGSGFASDGEESTDEELEPLDGEVEDFLEEEMGGEHYNPSGRYFPDTRPPFSRRSRRSHDFGSFGGEIPGSSQGDDGRILFADDDAGFLGLDSSAEVDTTDVVGLQQAVASNRMKHLQGPTPFSQVEDLSRARDIREPRSSVVHTATSVAALLARETLIALVLQWPTCSPGATGKSDAPVQPPPLAAGASGSSLSLARDDSITGTLADPVHTAPQDAPFSLVGFFGTEFLVTGWDRAPAYMGEWGNGLNLTPLDPSTPSAAGADLEVKPAATKDAYLRVSASLQSPVTAFLALLRLETGRGFAPIWWPPTVGVGQHEAGSTHSSHTSTAPPAAAALTSALSSLSTGEVGAGTAATAATLSAEGRHCQGVSGAACLDGSKPSLQSLLHRMLQQAIVSASPLEGAGEGSEAKTEGVALRMAAAEALALQLQQAAHRDFASFNWSGSASMSFTDRDIMRQPSLQFIQWLTDLLLESGDAGGVEDIEQADAALRQLFSAWAVTLRSPSMGLKEAGFRRLGGILGRAWRLDEAAQARGLPGVQWGDYLRRVPTARLEALAQRRLHAEMEDSPRCSRYLQTLVEFASMLRFAKEQAEGEASSGAEEQSKGTSALSFHGGMSYVSVRGARGAPNFKGPWTLEVWVRRRGRAGALNGIEVVDSGAALDGVAASGGVGTEPASQGRGRTGDSMPGGGGIDFTSSFGAPSGFKSTLGREPYSTFDRDVASLTQPKGFPSQGDGLPRNVSGGSALESVKKSASTREAGKASKSGQPKILASAQEGFSLLLECGAAAREDRRSVGIMLPKGVSALPASKKGKQGRRRKRGVGPLGKLPSGARVTGTPDGQIVSFGYEAPVGEWTHLAFVANGSTISLAVNGQRRGAAQQHALELPSASDMLPPPAARLGSQTSALRGDLMEVRLWRCARTTGELRRDMNTMLPQGHLPTTLAGYWRMADGMGKYVADMTEQQDRCFTRGTSWVSIAEPPVMQQDDVSGAADTRALESVSKVSADCAGTAPPFSAEDVSEADVQAVQDAFAGDASGWKEFVGYLVRDKCEQLGGTWARTSRQAVHVKWHRVNSASQANSAAETLHALQANFAACGNAHCVGTDASLGEGDSKEEDVVQGGAAESKEGASGDAPTPWSLPTGAVIVLGQMELPESLAQAPLVGWFEPAEPFSPSRREPVLDVHNNPGKITFFLRDLLTGAPDALSWLPGSRFEASLSSEVVQGSWASIAAVPAFAAPRLGSSVLHPALHGDGAELDASGSTWSMQRSSGEFSTALGILGVPAAARQNCEPSSKPDEADDDPSGRQGLQRSRSRAGGSDEEKLQNWKQVMDGAITSGKWMWEAKVLSVQGHVVVGMATRGAVVRNHLGCERQSWGFKSNRECFHKGSSKPYGKPFSGGDVIGVEVDMDNGTIEWLVNGTGLGIAYTDLRAQAMEHSSVCHIPDGKGVVPGLTTYAQGDAVKLLGLKSGHGVRTWSEEDSLSGVRRRYEGQWHLGQMHGLGELTVAGDEAGTWSGYWLAGIQQGVHKWVPSSGADGDAEPTPKYFKFEDGVKGEEVDEAACSADHEQRAGAVAKSLDEAKLAANSAPRPKPRVAPIRGSFQADQDTPFVWMKSVAGRSINVTDDLKKVSHSRSSSGMIMGSRGFSGGVHYWEVYLKAEFTDEGRMLHEQLMTNSGGAMLYVGVAERRVSDAESWRDYGYMNYMAVKSSFQSERLYGQHMMPNDRIGVLLNMDEGTLTFTRDGEMFGEFKYDNFGPAFRYIRSGTRGGPTSRVLYPIIGLSSPADPVTLADTKWLSIPAVPPAAHLDSVLEAATLLQRWDRPAAARARIPEALRAESYSRWLSMSAGHHVQATTRIGVAVAYDRSTTACAAVLARLGKAGKALRGGDRVTFQGKGSTIVGVYRQRLWYRKDGDAEAWYFKADDLNEVAVHARPADVQAEEDRELAAEAAADAAWKAAIEAGSTPVKASLAATKGADMTREAFDALLDDDRWTIAADMALVRLVNMQCDESGVEPENLALRPAAREEGHPAWMSESSNLSLMQARFAVLLRLNARLKGLLPLVDLTVSRPHLVAAHAGKISYPSALGRRVAALRGLAFTRTKLQHWRRVLAATVLYTEPAGENFMRASSVPELSVNRVKAHVLKLKQIPSHKERMRTSVFGQLMSQVKGWEAAQFRRDYSYEADLGQQRNFFVKLDNEGVDDNGGPYRQVIETALRSEAPGPLGLLVPCQNAVLGKGGNRDKLVFAGVSDEEVAEIARASSGSRTSDSDALAAAAKEATLARKRALRFLGVLAGTALRHDALMGVNLPALVWRPLVGQPVSEREVFELDHDFSSAIAHLRALQPPAEGASAEERALAERALTESAVSAVGCVRDDDASRKARLERAAQRLTFAKREPFVKAVIEAAARATEAPLLPFMHGLGSVVPHELLPMWTHEELETLLAGRPHVDVGLLERVVRYDGGFDSAHPTIVALWKVLRSMPQSMLRKFLDFVSARQRLPASPDGFLQPFKVVSLGAEAAQQGKLPKGISCFFTLQLPEYTDEDTLRAKLELGILNSWTMDADWQVGSRAGVMEGFDFMDVVEEGDEAEEGGGAAASRAD